MVARADTSDYRQLFLQDAPMMDMRAPAEFQHGAFPSALSLPLMTDEERAQVGICYKQQGQQAAIELGHQLVAGQTREQRLAQWREFCSPAYFWGTLVLKCHQAHNQSDLPYLSFR